MRVSKAPGKAGGHVYPAPVRPKRASLNELQMFASRHAEDRLGRLPVVILFHIYLKNIFYNMFARFKSQTRTRFIVKSGPRPWPHRLSSAPQRQPLPSSSLAIFLPNHRLLFSKASKCGSKNLNRPFSKEDTQMANKCMKRPQYCLLSEKCKPAPQGRKWTRSGRRGRGEAGPSHSAGGDGRCCGCCGRQPTCPSRVTHAVTV